MSTQLRVLILEDSEDRAILVIQELIRGGYDPIYERVNTPIAMESALEKEEWDIVFSNSSISHFSGIDALSLLRKKGFDMPFFLVIDSANEAQAVDAMKAGANDYFIKDNLTRLVVAVERELRKAEAQLKEETPWKNEACLKLQIERMPIGCITWNTEFRVASWNPAAERIFGFTANEAIGKHAYDFLVPQNVKLNVDTIWHRLLEGDTTAHSVNENITKDGRTIICDWFNTPLKEADGTVTGVLSMVEDITDRKRNEEQIRLQLQRLSTLREIDKAINTILDQHVIFDIFLDKAISQLRIDAADILLLDTNMQTLEYAAGRGFFTSVAQHTHLHLSEDDIGRSILERRTICIPNLAQIKVNAHNKLFVNESFQAYYCVPLFIKGQPKGVFEVFHRAPLNPNQEWLDFLEILAGQAAIAIDNITMFEELQKSNLELILTYDSTLEALVRALDLRDKETEGHSQRVAEITVQIAKAMGISKPELAHIRRGALIHDIGKIGIPDNILHKPGKLTDEEWVIMRKHTVNAYEILSSISFLRPALDIPYCHHEKWDGTGYPRGLKGEQIPLSARIFAVVDIWDALRSDRPYHSSWPEEKVREYIRSLAGNHLDPKVVEVFLEKKW